MVTYKIGPTYITPGDMRLHTIGLSKVWGVLDMSNYLEVAIQHHGSDMIHFR